MIKYIYNQNVLIIDIWYTPIISDHRVAFQLARNSLVFIIEVGDDFSKIMSCTGKIGYLNNYYFRDAYTEDNIKL